MEATAIPRDTTPTRAVAQRQSRWRENALIAVVLTSILLLGGWLRFNGLNWDDFTHLHPDERFLTDVAQGLGRQLNPSGNPEQRDIQIAVCNERYPNTAGMGGFFDALCSPWNPHNANSAHGLYVYGTLPLFMTRAAGDVMVAGSEWVAHNILAQSDPTYADYSGAQWRSYDGIHLVWRFLSAIAEMSAIVFVFVIGMTLHDKWIGLTAAALYSVVVFSIQMAHFGTVDAIGNFFTIAALYAIIRVQRGGGTSDYLWAGVLIGCALASRINLAPLAGVLFGVAGLRVLPIFDRRTTIGERDRLLILHAGGFLLALVAAAVVFRIANPYAFMGPDIFGLALNQRWLDNMGTAQLLVSGAIDSPPNFQWVGRTTYLFPWQNMVLWGMGAPLGIVAWLAFAIALWRIIRGRPGALANIVLVVWIAGYFGFLGRSWVTTMRYFLPIYPALVLLAAWGLVTLVRSASGWRWRAIRWLPRLALVGVVGFTVVWALMFSNIYQNLLTRVQAVFWVHEQVPGDFAMQVAGAPAGTPLININLPNRLFGGVDRDLTTRATMFDERTRGYERDFVPALGGVVSEIYAPHLGDMDDDPQAEHLAFTIYDVATDALLAQAELVADLPRDAHPLGNAYTIPFDAPFEVVAGRTYRFRVDVLQGNVVSGGSIFTWEGAWDDPIPTKVCIPPGVRLADRPSPGIVSDSRDCPRFVDPAWDQVIGYKQDIVYEDVPEKRDFLLQTLHESDYLVISSNRFYDTLSRNPLRWPMTNLYYEKLFAGELGYSLAAMFQETFELGPLRVSDQHLPFYDSPRWLNEFEAEEAFHVYDHPVVFIFQRNADYDRQAVEDILYSVPLTRVNDVRTILQCPDTTTFFCDSTLSSVAAISSDAADSAPTALRLTSEMAAIQFNGGTWSDRFNSASPVSNNLIVSVVVWWGTIVVFGLAAFPLLFALLPGLADRGWALSKFAGMLIAAWATWYLASLRIPVWSQAGIAGALIALAIVGIILLRRQGGDVGAFLRERWRLIITIEGVTLILFLAFLAVRLTNPDLWHPSFGGEKPMDFAYFNGVLRSTIFPPYDPWNAGGYINYYYFGFVIVGAPTLLLKMVPSVAYNLILPTLYALTGIAAFGTAYAIVDRLNRSGVVKRWGSPLTAGLLALVLAVVAGNLDTPRVFLNGVAQMGGYVRPTGIENFLVTDYLRGQDSALDPGALDRVRAQAANPSLWDNIRYETDNVVQLFTTLGNGASRLAQGQPLLIGAERWFWAPSRILAETPGVAENAITEMPIFTFVYGDLHAHMIAMPMQLFALALIVNALLIARDDTRSNTLKIIALAVLGVTVGMLQATNTWDWITYMLLGVVGTALAWWFSQDRHVQPGAFWARFSRASLIALVLSVIGFIGFSVIGSLPYTTWFASGYTSIRLWESGKTPLWAFFSIHGLFLFAITSLLAWDSGRWLRSVTVASLRGRIIPLTLVWAGVAALLLAAVGLAFVEYQATLVVLPLLVWTAILFFRVGQDQAMRVVLLMIGLALGLVLGVEYIVLDGDIGRQNTIFKFYLQAWFLFSVASGVGLAWLLRASDGWRDGLRGGWLFVFSLLLIIACIFPFTAASGRSFFRFDLNAPYTLDGMEFMTYARQFEGNAQNIADNPGMIPFPLAEDHAMIRWLQETIIGTPIIMEGLSEDTQYKWNGRIAIYTGLPSVIGWNWHQRQQRSVEGLSRFVEVRNANVNAFYHTDNIGTAWSILRHYQAQYVIVGYLEHAYYRPEGLAKFARMVDQGLLEVVWQQGKSTIYRVNPAAELPTLG